MTEVKAMFDQMQGDIERTVDNTIELCYFMRGAIGYEEMMNRTPGERQRISQFIEKRLDSQKGAMSPVF